MDRNRENCHERHQRPHRPGGGPPRRRSRVDLAQDSRQSRARLPGGQGRRLAGRLPHRARVQGGARRRRSGDGVSRDARDGPRAHHRDPLRVRRAAGHRARVRSQRHRHLGRRRGGGAGRRARQAAGRNDPGDRHARRGGWRRQDSPDQGRRVPDRGRGHDDPRLRPLDPAPGPARHHARGLRVPRARRRMPRPIRGRASTRSTP